MTSTMCFLTQAQTDPGTSNLKHQWTFNDGTANDAIGGVNGTLKGGAVIDATAKALKTAAAGDYLSFSGTDLALNTYSELTLETWATSSNTEWNAMLCYFGDTTNGLGSKGVFIQTRSRSAISCADVNAPWSSEDNVNGIGCNNGALHHLVTVVSATDIKFYIDGILQGSQALRSGNSVSAIGTGAAFIGKSGYNADPTWQGLIYEFSIYNKALTADEINFLFLKGDGATPFIKSSVSSIETSSSASFKVLAGNLSTPVTITVPAGITVTPSTLQANNVATPVNIAVVYDGTSTVDGDITLTSDAVTLNIPVKATPTGFSCFTPLYADTVSTNLIVDPYCSTYANEGWGTKGINTDPAFIYCGGGSGEIAGGSYDRVLTGKLKPNTKYRVKAKVWQVSGTTVGIGIYGWDGTAADIYHAATTSDAWEDIDFTFTTGATLNSGGHGTFFNSGTGYIDNWEMYEVPVIRFSSSSLTYLSSGTHKVAVKGIHLGDDISITAPANFSVNPTTLSATVNGDSVSIIFDGLATSNGYVYFTSGTTKDSIQVSGTADPTIVTSTSFLTFDELNTQGTFTVSGGNLTDSIRITVPSGYSVNPKALGADASGITVTVTFDGTAESKGFINVTSGTTSAKVRVIGTLNSTTFTPLYAAGNLITDPYFNSLDTYAGWGSKSIITDTAEVYGGSKSLKMTGACGASLDYSLNGKVLANTTYRLKAIVKTTGKYKFMVNGCGVNGLATDYLIDVNTNGNWEAIDVTFTTGTLAANQNLFFNSCEGYDGTLAYVDNYELYVFPVINVSPSTLLFSGAATKNFTATGVNLSQSITITAPTGFTVSPTTLDATASNATVSVTYDGVAESDTYIYLTSGTVKDSVRVAGVPVVPSISVDPKSLSFTGAGTKSFTATGVGLTQTISITAPDGFTVTPSTLNADASGETVTVTYNGTAAATGYVYLASGTIKDSVGVSGTITAIGTTAYNNSQFVYISNGLINVSFDLAQTSDVALSLYNTDGKLLMLKKGKYIAGTNHAVLNGNLSSGLYVVNIVKNGKSFNYKIVVK